MLRMVEGKELGDYTLNEATPELPMSGLINRMLLLCKVFFARYSVTFNQRLLIQVTLEFS